MKSNKLTRLMLLALFTTGTIPELLVAQEQQERNNKLPRYRVIDLVRWAGRSATPSALTTEAG